MKAENMERFSKLASKADSINSKIKYKRFWPMTHSNKKGKITTIGLYDYDKKRYVLVDTRSHTLDECVGEMERMLEN